MSGPFHHGSSGFPEPPSPNRDSPSPNTALARSRLMGFTEAASDSQEHPFSQAAQLSTSFYTHPSRISILNSAGDLPYGNFSDTDNNMNMNMETPVPARPADSTRTSRDRTHQLIPSFSRAFHTIINPEASDKSTATSSNKDALNPTPFFVPSYLEGSTYVRKLEEAHRSKLQARESNRSSANGLAPNLTTFKPQQSSLPPGSHRGMSHTVVERPPPFEDEDTLEPLPTRWNKDDQWGGIEIASDGLSVKYMSPRTQYEREQHEACAVRADHYMPAQCGVYYFEVQIVSAKQGDTTISVGFSTKTATLSRPVGWEPEAWGYHGDDGRVFTGQNNNGKSYAPPYNPGDVIGCGVNFRTKTAFFTKNGVNLGIAFRDVGKGKLYPSISLKKGGEVIRANFGQTAFVYNIDDMMKEERNRIERDIKNCDITKLVPGLNETELLQTLVLQFLQHDGYVEAARAFAEEIQDQKQALNLDSNVKIDGINIKDDEDANNRQRIRKAILEGDIDRALKYTNAYYPQVLQSNEQVYFRLRCRRFIEMVRRAAHLRTSGQPKKTNGHVSDTAPQAMDVDLTGSDNTWTGSSEADGGEMSPELLELEISMLNYGQSLQAEYANDPRKEVSKALMDIWALVAYPDPLKEPQVSHLLDKNGRVAVAEELNSAILLSLGKSSRASLETLYAQTVVLLEDLRQDGGEGAFISIDDIMEGVPRPTPL